MGIGCSKETSVSRGTKLDMVRCCFGGVSCDSDRLTERKKGRLSGRNLWKLRMNQKLESDKVRCGSCIKGECLGGSHVPTISSSIEFDEWVQDNASSVESAHASSSMTTTNRQLSEPSSSPFHLQLDSSDDHISMRSNGDTSLVSSEANTHLSASLIIPEPTAVTPERVGIQCGAGQDQVIDPFGDLGSHTANALSEPCEHGPSLRSHLGVGNSDTRPVCRRIGTSEPHVGSVQFSRQLSVGRLRDRVLRRHGVSTGPLNQMSDNDVSRDRHGNVRQLWAPMIEEVSNRNVEPWRSFSNFSGRQNQQAGVDTISNDRLTRRTTFLERRQRVRSRQVHALQRLGSRFENLVGHDRSCILSGHYRSGHCLCGTNTRRVNASGQTNTRASISRIVMLAEALFEVLDDIHQQSVVLSSRPSLPSFGSLPAPKEVVERLPVRVYAKSGLKNDDSAQCQICLGEYAEGDWLRILPCHHEFHQSCIDKWLKEIHRICPHCRGNICLSNSFPLEGVD